MIKPTKKMKTIQTIILFVLIGFVSKAQNLDSETTFTNIFNESEIKDLEKIQSFFNDKVCSQNIAEKNLVECYENYFKKIGKSSYTGNFNLLIPYSEQLNIYSEISKATFNEIWKIKELTNELNGKKYQEIKINLEGKYAKFLKELSLEYPEITEYYDFLESEGDYSISAISQYYAQISEDEINKMSDIRMRFISAIYFLTLNDKLLRN